MINIITHITQKLSEKTVTTWRSSMQSYCKKIVSWRCNLNKNIYVSSVIPDDEFLYLKLVEEENTRVVNIYSH
jgi:hypothetical protein